LCELLWIIKLELKDLIHIKELGPKGPCYSIMQHFSCPRYITHHNSHKSDNYLINTIISEMSV